MTQQMPPATLSASVLAICEQLDDLKITKTEFARQLGVSPDYVYRVLKGRVPFPRVRETIERMADICQVDPRVFAEYREIEAVLSASTRLVWRRMRERDMVREDLFLAMGGRISRPYFNSILRGDQPFPNNRAYIQLFALALDLPPTVFKEHGLNVLPRWNDEDVRTIEDQFYNLLFDKMLADHGFAKHPIKLGTLGHLAASVFPSDLAGQPRLGEVLQRMGDLGMGLSELEKVSGVSLREILASPEPDRIHATHLGAIRKALRIDEPTESTHI